MPRRSQQRQYTFLSHKPTHFRVKTETDASQENRSITKHLTFKRPLVSFRQSQIQIESSQKTSNQTFAGRKTPAERSFFGEININQMPKFKKQTISPQEHPLNEYINSGIQKNVQRNVKRYKTSGCESQIILPRKQKKSSVNLTMIPVKTNQSSFSSQISKEQKAMFKIVDEIYKKISKFNDIGFPDKKINEWIYKYCFQKRNYMTDLLLKFTGKNKLIQSSQNYIFERDPEKVKQKLLVMKKKVNGEEKSLEIYDLVEFSQYIEEILVHKNKSKILELRDSISEKLEECFIYNRQKNQSTFGRKFYSPEMLNFMTDLNEFQKKNGHFNKISNVNREYFTDLGSTEKEIRSKVYELIQATQKGFNPLRELKKSSTVKLQRRSPRWNVFIKQAPDEVIELVDDFEEEQNLS